VLYRRDGEEPSSLAPEVEAARTGEETDRAHGPHPTSMP
jgi:hypothetical protein